MNRNIGLVVDSTFGLDKKYAKENHITVVPLKVIIDDKEYVDGEIAPEIINQALYDKRDIKTSQPSPEQFIRAYEEQLEKFDYVICMTISKSLSGTFNSANLGKTILENENIYVVDSESNINGAAYLAEKLIEYLDEGHHISDALGYLEKIKEKGSLVFTVDNLQYLVKSGRISKVQAVIGNVLKIKPILRFERGVLGLESKVRGFNNVIAYLVKEVHQIIENGKAIVRIAYVDKSVEAKMLEHEIYQIGENVSVKITGIISPVVSAHVGPGGLGIYLTLA
ncbi:MAG: DegV family protein [Tenericutes bacterium HGW-Tenericutes-2]|jgi:DegV family protein with EDD domain|nr:MAG: DegV family protein [Tenericutes bacterium HGW-Tenericutes-2]